VATIFFSLIHLAGAGSSSGFYEIFKVFLPIENSSPYFHKNGSATAASPRFKASFGTP
jgi:hypothetical protein